MGVLELTAEIIIGLLKTLAMTEVIAAGFTGDEAEGN